MDIVDAQVHANVLGTEATLAVMDALGIQGLLFDEYQTTTEDGAPQPGYRLADGAFRPVGPNAEAAALRHPERFAFLMRVDLRDPGIEGWIETLAAAPGFKALRTLVSPPARARCSRTTAATDCSMLPGRTAFRFSSIASGATSAASSMHSISQSTRCSA